jgi:hypothetical protein
MPEESTKVTTAHYDLSIAFRADRRQGPGDVPRRHGEKARMDAADRSSCSALHDHERRAAMAGGRAASKRAAAAVDLERRSLALPSPIFPAGS